MKMMILLIMLMSIMLGGQVMAAQPGQADKSPEQLCRERNAASCEINGLKFFLTEQECPAGAKVLRKLGHENCDQYAAVKSVPLPVAASAVAGAAAKDAAVPADQEKQEDFYWNNPYFILLLIGVLQGMVSRASAGALIIVLGVMPVIGTWTIVTGAHLEGGVVANAGYIGTEWLGTLLFSSLGWLAGAGIRRIAYRIILGVR